MSIIMQIGEGVVCEIAIFRPTKLYTIILYDICTSFTSVRFSEKVFHMTYWIKV